MALPFSMRPTNKPMFVSINLVTYEEKVITLKMPLTGVCRKEKFSAVQPHPEMFDKGNGVNMLAEGNNNTMAEEFKMSIAGKCSCDLSALHD